MKKNLLTGLVTGSLIGMAFGCQQSTSILLSSFHDLAVFPLTSLIAIAFILFLHAVFFALLGVIFALIFGWLIKKKPKKSNWLIPANLGFLIGLVVFIFLFGRLQSVFQKKIIFGLVITMASLSGAFFGFLFFTLVVFLEKKKKIWLRVRQVFAGFSLFLFVGLSFLVLGLTVNHFFNGLPGLPKKAKINQVATSEKPNIVLLTIDAQRADHLGAYGYQSRVTPQLDQIAEQGVVFEQMFVNAPWTLPSLASMVSSRLPTELKISVDNLSFGEIERTNRLTNQVETIAERMQTLGYNTQAILTNELLSVPRGFDQGFDGFVNLEKLMPYHYQFHFKNMALTLLLNRIPGVEKRLANYYTFLVGPSGLKQFETRAWEINRWALPWLEDFQDKRFFLWLHYIDPHAPYDPGPDYSPDLKEISRSREQELRKASAYQPDKIRWREIDKQALVELYDGDVSLVDAAIGQVWEKLDQLDLMEKTVLIISADHGEELWDHGGLGHGLTFYQETIKIPLIIVGPGIEPRKVYQNVSLIDIFPTIIDLIGERIPSEAKGRSLKPLIEGQFLPDKEILSEGTGRGTEKRAIILGDYKLIHDFFTGEDQLFNIRTDLNDKFDLARTNPRVVSQLKEKLLSLVDQLRENRQEIFQEAEPAGPPLGDVVGY
ncbi:MAG TPA: sulfatase-like hydrolase/transferase [Patescibacteria group bacterium]|nr:sulfatase-like hydrolase/transferase [Patescibacteria group bacterium]